MQYNRILIADDEKSIREMVKDFFSVENIVVDEAKDGMEAIEKAETGQYDLIILDVMMPRVDGWAACREIRSHSQTPILMLTARGEEYDKLFGFELGADDYVTKPFSPKELLARVKAIVKRAQGVKADCSEFSGLKIDYSAKVVEVDGERVSLAPREFELLAFLSRNPGIAFSREQLLREVWGYDFYGDDRTVDTHVKAVRNAIGPYRKFIATVWGTGYRFEADKN